MPRKPDAAQHVPTIDQQIPRQPYLLIAGQKARYYLPSLSGLVNIILSAKGVTQASPGRGVLWASEPWVGRRQQIEDKPGSDH